MKALAAALMGSCLMHKKAFPLLTAFLSIPQMNANPPLLFHHIKHTTIIKPISAKNINRHWMEVSQPHTIAGEICGFFTWIWVFHRARQDLPVVLGLRHPWEHGEDPWAIKDHVDNLDGLQSEWESFQEKAGTPGEDDDDEDEDDG